MHGNFVFAIYCCPLKVFDRYKLGLDSSLGIQPFKLSLFC